MWLLPAVVFQKDIFYMKPKAAPLADADSLLYEGVPVGKETLCTMLAKMCEQAGIEQKSNHSLRATGATEMFAANVPEKLNIQWRTGHRSLDALRSYERPSHEQHQAVSNVLTSAVPQRSIGDELTNVQSTAQLTGVGSMLENHSQAKSTIVQSAPWQMPSHFGSMNHCSVNVNVNVNAPQSNKSVEEDFDKLVANVHFHTDSILTFFLSYLYHLVTSEHFISVFSSLV